MIQYSRLGAKIWYSGIGYGRTTDVEKDEIGYLDYQLLQWQKKMPDELRRHEQEDPESSNRALRRLQVFLYLRANQMRILIYRPVLHSTASALGNRQRAQTVIDVAKDSIQVLVGLSQTSDIYHTLQVGFNYFLVSALAVLVLAVVNASVEYRTHVRDEFYMALDLVKKLSNKSYTSKRLWNTIKCLREVGEKLRFSPHSGSLRAAGTNGNIGSSVPGRLSEYEGRQVLSTTSQGEPSDSPMNGLQMSNELTDFFEIAGDYLTFNGGGGPNGMDGLDGDVQPSDGGMPTFFGNEDEFSRIIGDLF